MGLALRVVGTALLLASVIGLGVLGAAVVDLQSFQPIAEVGQSQTRSPRPTTQAAHPVTEPGPPRTPEAPLTTPEAPHPTPQTQNITEDPQSIPRPAAPRITHVDIAAIGLSADVVPAKLIPRGAGLARDLPDFKIGHAESTADAGQTGNAVLLGHISSLHSGNVFAHLDQVHVGQAVHVFAGTREFDYTVVSTRHVPRTETGVMAQNTPPTVSLITCTGVWLPTIWDYMERLVVRAELDPWQLASR